MRARSCVVREKSHGADEQAVGHGVADQRIAHHKVGRADQTGERGDDEHGGRVEPVREAEGGEAAREHKIEAAHRRDHGAAAEPVAEGADRRRHKRAEELERGEGGLEHHRPGRDQHEPVEDQRLHLEGERGRKVARPLEPEAPHGEGREDGAQTGGAFRLDVGNRS